ncbi:GAF domain-containing protein [Aphanothece sacrum]|uniref:GAF domain-containing protein n=1 Tax=Aphanothece sacrum FPU1 TaxID=1920663 RepID=A0A401IIY3_APHSA|nr:GAF domain-containing protein [Aphanothece sacrum]GBF81247.1 hypothetical protein AsFPU1_2659 [Aphanothece sacrum FPU1]GBF83403.1 hypothetical protein AsFPU3_0445 [Aphanothece sacrum FPU3]
MGQAKPSIPSSSEKLLGDLIALRKFGNLLLQETSSVDSTEIEKKVGEKTLQEQEQLVDKIFKQTLDDIINQTFNKIRAVLNPQVISVFLFSKDGCIEKYKTWGKDCDNQEIENGWLKDEKYERGQSFSGKATQGDPYGEPHFSNNLDTDIDKLLYGEYYQEKLGFLKCGISVPLDSYYRTFGTIEVLNKLDSKSQQADENSCYSQEEVFELTLIGGHLGKAISRVRKKQEEIVIAQITQILVNPNKYNYNNAAEIYQSIIKQLVSKLTPYKACILRFLEGDRLPVFETASTYDIKMTERRNEIRKIGEGMVGKVAETGQYMIKHIDENPDDFRNREWITKQKLKSFICFPLSIQGEVVGTLSLFTGYKHIFTSGDLDFVTNFSRLLAAYKIGLNEEIKVMKDHNNSEQYIEEQFTKFQAEITKLRQAYLNKYVWFEDGEVLDSDDDEITLIKRVYTDHPDKQSQPLFIEKVTDENLEPEIWCSRPL